jgi:putative transposase
MSAENQRPQRLHRLEHLFTRSPIYFLTACSASRCKILSSTALHEAFRAFGDHASDRGAWIGRYILMPDHLHLFIAVDDELIKLPLWVKSLKNALSKQLRDNGVPSPHWQKGFFDHVLRSGESYRAKWDYVRDNPVRAGLIANADDWPFSGEIHDLEYHDRRS